MSTENLVEIREYELKRLWSGPEKVLGYYPQDGPEFPNTEVTTDFVHALENMALHPAYPDRNIVITPRTRDNHPGQAERYLTKGRLLDELTKLQIGHEIAFKMLHNIGNRHVHTSYVSGFVNGGPFVALLEWGDRKPKPNQSAKVIHLGWNPRSFAPLT